MTLQGKSSAGAGREPSPRPSRRRKLPASLRDQIVEALKMPNATVKGVTRQLEHLGAAETTVRSIRDKEFGKGKWPR